MRAGNGHVPRHMDTTATVYFISNGMGHVKIGATSRDVVFRLEDMQVHNAGELKVELTTTGGYPEEARLHELFKPFHVRGEWFRFTLEIRKYIDNYLEENVV